MGQAAVGGGRCGSHAWVSGITRGQDHRSFGGLGVVGGACGFTPRFPFRGAAQVGFPDRLVGVAAGALHGGAVEFRK